MILSAVTLTKREALQARLCDVYAWHQGIWQAFPGRDGDRRDFLFRVDDRSSSFRLYVLSHTEPAAPPWGRWQSKAVGPSFLEHARYRFQLKANPTLRQSESRKRVGLCDETKLRNWMQRKADQHGFAVAAEELVITPPMEETFVKHGRRGKHLAVDLRGVLTVTDRDRFRAAFETGIGSAKAFGFGLLLLQPIA